MFKRLACHLALVRLLLGFSGLLLLLATAGCSDSGQEEFGGPDYGALVITSDMAVGPSRVAFGVVGRDGFPVRADTATVRAYFLPPDRDDRVLKSTVEAAFLDWPTTARGVFEVVLDFDTAGHWQIEADLAGSDGQDITAASVLSVQEESSTPAIGSPAPASVTPKAADVEDLSHISSAVEHDPDLYQLSIHEALADGKPLIVVFATPAFCLSATCGPIVSELTSVKDKYAGRANFIHVEVVKDPHLLDDGRSSAEWVDTVREWGLPTEPWTFLVDAQGLVRAKFEQFTPAAAMEAALLEIL